MDQKNCIAALHASPWKVVIACTGAGAGVQQLLWAEPGASATLMEAIFPYHRLALADLIGHEPEKYVSTDTALWIATAAHRRAAELVIRSGGDPKHAIGLGVTGAVATATPKKGEHRCVIATRTSEGMATVNITFEKGMYGREGEGSRCDILAVNTLLAAAGLEQGVCPPYNFKGVTSPELIVGTTMRPSRVVPLAETETGDLFDRTLFLPNARRERKEMIDPAKHILFHGSFNPWHFGHELMARQAERMTGKEVICAISSTHPDKGRLDRAELLHRVEQFRYRRSVVITGGAPLFADKAKMFPGVGMLIGADAALGILNPNYYGSSEVARDAVLRGMLSDGARFYVVGREIEGKFMTLDDLPIPHEFRKMFLPVSGRWDISSTKLRERV